MILRYGRSLPVLALFAKRDIEIGEELAYDYGKILATTMQGKGFDVNEIDLCWRKMFY